MFINETRNSDKKFKGIFVDAWRDLDNLRLALNKLQQEVDDPELEMTIGLIEGGLRFKKEGTEPNLLIEYLSVILMEVSNSLVELKNQKKEPFSLNATEALEEVNHITSNFQNTATKLQRHYNS